MFERLIRGLLARGHTVHVFAEGSKRLIAPGFNQIFDRLTDEHESFSWGELEGKRKEPWLPLASMLAAASIACGSSSPSSPTPRASTTGRAHGLHFALRLMMKLRLLKPARIPTASTEVGALENALPLSKTATELLDRETPDVVLLAPFIGFGESQADYLEGRAGPRRPVVVPIASWDNLTTKGVIRDVPDMTIVWNEDQVQEAIELHGVPAESVVATGAHSHDHWFAWEPSTGEEEFAGKVGLAADRPFLLYVCSSGFIAGADEVAFVREWFERLGASGDPALESLGVLVRPHPQNFGSWRDADLDQPGRIVVWPRGGVAPTNQQSKEDYYDSLYHAKAVVGINTSALVDSAIVRKPVFTMLHEQFRETQTGTLHFSYLPGRGAAAC